MQIILNVYDCAQNIVATAEGGTICGTENYRSFQEGFISRGCHPVTKIV
jgi:hypothetical protein